jgi:hypothetical protein
VLREKLPSMPVDKVHRDDRQLVHQLEQLIEEAELKAQKTPAQPGDLLQDTSEEQPVSCTRLRMRC